MYLDVFRAKPIIKDTVCRYHSANTGDYTTAIDNFKRIFKVTVFVNMSNTHVTLKMPLCNLHLYFRMTETPDINTN